MLVPIEGADRANAGASATEVLETFIRLWRQVVDSSGGASGCVVAGVAIDTDAREPGIIDVVRDTFRAWIALLTEQLQAAGLPAQRATVLATATLAGLEGALILCRGEGNSGPWRSLLGAHAVAAGRRIALRIATHVSTGTAP